MQAIVTLFELESVSVLLVVSASKKKEFTHLAALAQSFRVSGIDD